MVGLQIGWRRFFGPGGYPFSLDLVEARDNTDAQAAFLVQTLPPMPATVFDLGTGNGRHGRRLGAAGYSVVGFDLFPDGAAQSQNYNSVCADLERLPVPNESTDACVSMYSSVGYDIGTFARQLKEWARVTRTGGVLVLDLANRGRVVQTGRDSFQDGRGLMASVRIGSRRIQTNLAVSKNGRSIYAFSYPEPTVRTMRRQLYNAGWRMDRAFGDFDGSEWSSSSPRLLVRAVRCG